MYLCWCKGNCSFAFLKFDIWFCNTFLKVIMFYIILMCIYCFMFLLMNYHLLFILYVFYTMEMIDKKQIQAIFLFDFKMGHKAVETTHTINNAFGPQTLMNVWCSGGWRGFSKEVRALKMRSVGASHQKLTTNWEPSLKLIPLQHEKLLKNSTSTILWSLGIWSKPERWKSSVSGCLMN